jgi:hypothetical protein
LAVKNIEIDLEYLPIIEGLPQSPAQLHQQAASNDEPTIESWRQTWINNFKMNHANHGPFAANSIGKLFGQFDLKPCIIAGAGPSLANNIEQLKNKGNIPLISCLHNFHYMEDNGVEVDYYVTLDAGKVTIEEISEGGKHPHEHYLELSKKRKLLSFVSSDPELINQWQGEVTWFNCPIPDDACKKAFSETERFDHYVSNGGNVLGACLYIAKAYMGANPIAFVGADFAFGYKQNFHPFATKYDNKLGHFMRGIDCYGLPIKTWSSYHNFKCWFDSICIKCPGEWLNCTEGGTLGVYPQGLIKQIRHKPLKEFIDGFKLYRAMEYQANNPGNADEDPGIEGVQPQPKLFF